MHTSIDSGLWSIRSGFNGHTLHITQRSTGAVRSVSRSALPSAERMAQMTERQFDAACRRAFHGWRE